MFSKSSGNKRQLALWDYQINCGIQFFLTSVIIIQCHFLAVIIIQHLSVVKEKSSSSTVIQSKKSPNSQISVVSLPESDFLAERKHRMLACCEHSVVVLSLNGRVFTSQVDLSRVLKFSIVSELSSQEVVYVSGTYKHFLAFSKEGRFFGCGSNGYGELCLSKTESVSSFLGYKIWEAYAGFYHSLFQTREDKILSYDNNLHDKLVLRSSAGEKVYSPTETTITSGASFCIAGCYTSTTFIGKILQPNTPNKPIQRHK